MTLPGHPLAGACSDASGDPVPPSTLIPPLLLGSGSCIGISGGTSSPPEPPGSEPASAGFRSRGRDAPGHAAWQRPGCRKASVPSAPAPGGQATSSAEAVSGLRGRTLGFGSRTQRKRSLGRAVPGAVGGPERNRGACACVRGGPNLLRWRRTAWTPTPAALAGFSGFLEPKSI